MEVVKWETYTSQPTAVTAGITLSLQVVEEQKWLFRQMMLMLYMLLWQLLVAAFMVFISQQIQDHHLRRFIIHQTFLDGVAMVAVQEVKGGTTYALQLIPMM